MYTVGLDAQWLFFTLFSQLSIYRVAKFSTKGKGSDLDRTKEILFGSLLGFFAFLGAGVSIPSLHNSSQAKWSSSKTFHSKTNEAPEAAAAADGGCSAVGNKLPANFVTGLADAESSFIISIYKSNERKSG